MATWKFWPKLQFYSTPEHQGQPERRKESCNWPLDNRAECNFDAMFIAFRDAICVCSMFITSQTIGVSPYESSGLIQKMPFLVCDAPCSSSRPDECRDRAEGFIKGKTSHFTGTWVGNTSTNWGALKSSVTRLNRNETVRRRWTQKGRTHVQTICESSRWVALAHSPSVWAEGNYRNTHTHTVSAPSPPCVGRRL